METSRTNAQYKRNGRYNLSYEIEWILSVLWFFFRTTDTTYTTDTTIWKPGLSCFTTPIFFSCILSGIVILLVDNFSRDFAFYGLQNFSKLQPFSRRQGLFYEASWGKKGVALNTLSQLCYQCIITQVDFRDQHILVFRFSQFVTVVKQTFVGMAQSVLSTRVDSSVFVPLDIRARFVMVRINAFHGNILIHDPWFHSNIFFNF